MPSSVRLAQGETLVPNLGIKELLVCRRESNLPEVGSPYSFFPSSHTKRAACVSAQILVSNGSKMARGIARVFPSGDKGDALLPPWDSTLSPSVLAEGGPAVGWVPVEVYEA